MAYRQYTQCTSVANHVGGVAAQTIIAAAVGAIPLLAGAALGPGLLIVALYALIAYCRWWLYDRLICLEGDVCAVGMLVKIEPPEAKSGLDALDTDYSINLLLAPSPLGSTQHDAEEDAPQGHLIKNHPDIAGAGLDFSGYSARKYSNDTPSAVLHCEFEGAGVYDVLIAALAALAIAIAAAVVCAIPVIGWAACLVLSLIAAAVVAVGILVGLSDTGHPTDVDPNIGELHENDATGRGADVLVVKGTWVYDSAHSGYNEIHPIKHCQKTGMTWGGNWHGVDAELFVDHWCEAIGRAESPLTRANQDSPENKWTIHPEIDGCMPKDENDEEQEEPVIPK